MGSKQIALRLLSMGHLLLMLAFPLQGWTQGPLGSNEIWIEPHTYRSNGVDRQLNVKSTLRSRSSIQQGKRIHLVALDAAEIETRLLEKTGVNQKIGFTRPIPDLVDPQSSFEGMAFKQTAPQGYIGHVQFNAPGALALRIGMSFFSLPEKSELRFHGADPSKAILVTGADVLRTIRHPETGGPSPLETLTYWSPVVSGNTIGLEVYLPDAQSLEQFRFQFNGLTHLVIDPSAQGPSGLTPKRAASCNLDSRCYPAWSSATNAVARITFVEEGGSYLCSGTLLSDSIASNAPYFLTANHCISTQSVASSLEAYWFYYSSSCDSNQTYSGATRTSGGGQLLYSSSSTDATFMRLNSPPPSGVTFSGWTNAIPNLGIESTGLHNPTGDLQKISFGQTKTYLNCRATQNGQFGCDGSNRGDARFIDILFSAGTTEGGSSGSGIFLDKNKYLFGQLYGGDSDCSYTQGSNIYGLFGQTYSAGNLGQWLVPSKVDQIITFNTSGNLVWGSTIGYSATASSGLTVLNESATPSICAVENDTIRGLLPGACQIVSRQPGDTVYNSASLTSTLEVTPPNYPQPRATLTAKVLKGNGRIESSPAGISCGVFCSYGFTKGAIVQLTAIPTEGSKFTGWSGACTGKKTVCQIRMNKSKSVKAKFQ